MPTLIVVGASARAAAVSALRAGFTPWCVDLFADVDLRAIVPNAIRCPVGHYPSALLEVLRSAPESPWIYTGGLENHPDLIRAMADVRPLWGNGPNALVAARSPFVVEQCLRDAGLPVPEVRSGEAELPDYCRWLRKPLAGSAGQGIAFVDPADPGRSSRHYYQQYIDGTPMSAVYVRSRGETRLLGVTEQLIGTDWLNAAPFRYAGNVGPIELPGELRHDLEQIGSTISERCDLLGLFGVDFILRDSRTWVVEVNPRYTASIEVLELATGLQSLSHHRLAFDDVPDAAASSISPLSPLRGEGPGERGLARREQTPPPNPLPEAGRGSRKWDIESHGVVAKGVLYAADRVVMPRYELDALKDSIGAPIADVPARGEVIEKSWPILTVIVDGSNQETCVRELRRRACLIERWLQLTQPLRL